MNQLDMYLCKGLKTLTDKLDIVEKCIEVCDNSEVRETLYVIRENLISKINEVLNDW